MRQGQNGKRSRGNRRNNNSANRTIDSSGPEVKIRGTTSQLYEKYQALARDANIAGERIASENYLQHAEHYFRLMNQASAGNGQTNQNTSDREPRRDNRQHQSQRTAPSGNGAADGPTASGTVETTASEDTDKETAAGSTAAGTASESVQPQRRRRARGRRPASTANPTTSTSPANPESDARPEGGAVAELAAGVPEPAARGASAGDDTKTQEGTEGGAASDET